MAIPSLSLIGFRINGKRAIFPHKIDEHLLNNKVIGYTFFHHEAIEQTVVELETCVGNGDTIEIWRP